ncbi:hypothetical protein COCMIDRAFT_32819 [Bipolaris oryzae ATCC 44560]|uniref:CBF1-interacting co-repressor CIR N-terminal domain-containing protein n=1 Tax=Bipolaris oryzae ATCC 44560 TaxID=930090 RepID=W6ZQN4_COCMI|nr:uncharacterized protein COCMIDRAFT_32819 [Bipolaris oryzae ATCC 44560]EUC49804.1 hypothetical protein COCMIDRAFT_32819 [Bipolaris oryzae ATCC 44560]
MPLHLLGKKSWNVYNADNVARVKADEAAAAAREAAHEQRMQELDAQRRAAILRGETPPPLPEEASPKHSDARASKNRDERGHGPKRRKLAGEDDTDMDIRLAKSITAPDGDGEDKHDAKVLKLRSTASDAPLHDHAGHIDLFPVDMKEALKREKNAEVEKEKRKKERALEDQYTMRFSNAAGRGGIEQPWYATQQRSSRDDGKDPDNAHDVAAYEGFVNKDVLGNEDPRRKERELARISSNDPFAFMQQAQAQLKKAKRDKKLWAEERDRELRELRTTQDQEESRSRHHKRKRKDDHDDKPCDRDSAPSSRYKHRHRSRSRSRDRHHHKSSHRSERRWSRSRSRDRDRNRHKHRDRSREGREKSRTK